MGPFSSTLSHMLPREPLEAFLGDTTTEPHLVLRMIRLTASSCTMRPFRLASGPRPQSEGICRSPIPPIPI